MRWIISISLEVLEVLKKHIRNSSCYVVSVTLLFLTFKTGNSYGQDQKLPPDSILPKKNLAFNEADFGFTTARIGMAVISEFAAYSQDANGKKQMDSANVELKDQVAVRDFRFFSSGRINSKRYLVWKIAVMYDGVERAWTFRETGLLIGVPELKGRIFIGRSKEGYAFNKVQNGYSCPAMERQPSLDMIPIMTDGIRYYGDIKKPNLFWSIGAFSNVFYGNNSKFMLWNWTYSGRFGWLPLYEPKANKVVHLGMSIRYAKPVNEKINIKSRPESNPAPYFIQTGTFDSDKSTVFGTEAYYFNGPFMIGSEMNFSSFKSVQAGDPHFWGGNIILTYNLTGENYPYMKDNGTSFFIEPKRSVFKGGIGAVQLLLTGTIFDTNNGLLPGGKFWKITPMVNWYLSNNFTFKLLYGYGVLDRFNITGKTQFFQARLQFQLM